MYAIRSYYEEIKKNKEELARMISTEQGKLFKVAQFEVDVCCSFIAYACECVITSYSIHYTKLYE